MSRLFVLPLPFSCRISLPAMLLGLVLLSLGLPSCRNRPAEGADGPAAAPPFFDLKGYFSGEIDRLKQQQPRTTKTIRIDGKTETHSFDSLAYDTELSVFLNADINRAAWWDKYTIDTLRSDEVLKAIHYRAKSKDLRIRDIRIEFADGGKVTRIYIERDADSPTAHLHQQFTYQPAAGYRIETTQNVTFSQPKEIIVEAEWK